MPTLGECPLKPSPSPASLAACLIRVEIWLGRSPNTLSAPAARFRICLSANMVGTDRNTTAPSPSASVLERRIRRRPVPSASVAMSLQDRAAASETLSIASRIRLISATSKFPRHLAVS